MITNLTKPNLIQYIFSLRFYDLSFLYYVLAFYRQLLRNCFGRVQVGDRTDKEVIQLSVCDGTRNIKVNSIQLKSKEAGSSGQT